MMEISSHADHVIDLGEQGCGQLLMEIMLAMRSLTPGQTLLVTAYESSAADDIAAWCRMTGNLLVHVLPDASGHQFLLAKGPHSSC
jgi:TusA-related sulfurtransferase